MHDKFAYVLLKTPVRIFVLMAWAIYIGVSGYGISILKVDFKEDFFISKNSQVYQYNTINKQYF